MMQSKDYKSRSRGWFIVTISGMFMLISILSFGSSASECPPDKPLKDTYGDCYSCNEASSVNVRGVTGNCAVCKNRVLQGKNKEYCTLPCPADKPLMDRNGTCYSCDEADSVYVEGVTGNCAVCSNRVLNGYYCALPYPANKPLMDEYGNSYSCLIGY